MHNIFDGYPSISSFLPVREVVNTVPVIKSYPVEAVQLTFTNGKFSTEFINLLDNCVICRDKDCFVIHTDKQTLVVNEGDYLIRTGIDRFLVCTEKVFREEYETTMVDIHKPLF
jgi:hypothetical protein